MTRRLISSIWAVLIRRCTKIAKISQMLEGKKIHKDVYFELYINNGIRENAKKAGLYRCDRKAGG